MPRKTPEQRRREAAAAEQYRESQARRLEISLRLELTRVAREAAAAYPNWAPVLRPHRKRLEVLFTVQLPRTTIGAAHLARETFAEPMARDLGMIRFLPTQEELDARVANLARARGVERAAEISDTSRIRIGNAVARSVEAHETPAQVAKAIRNEVGGMAPARARMIARTETAVATQQGQYQEMLATSEALDMPMGKTWVASKDDRTRETHAAADGQTVKMDDTFSVGEAELKFPSDPDGPPEEVINCRCGITYTPL